VFPIAGESVDLWLKLHSLIPLTLSKLLYPPSASEETHLYDDVLEKLSSSTNSSSQIKLMLLNEYCKLVKNKGSYKNFEDLLNSIQGINLLNLISGKQFAKQ
jgi:hypothetical protein